MALEDIFSLLDEESVVRSAFQEQVKLSDYDLPQFNPGDDYTSINIEIKAEEDTLDYQPKITEICKEGRHTKKQEKFHTGVMEAVRNAYQHGNKKDPTKKIQLSYRATENLFEVVVSDEGGKFDANFVPFVLLHRQGKLKNPVSFYDFASSVERPSENSGVGTYVIHMVSDEVKYFKNSSGGLSVQMIIHGPQLRLPGV